MHTYMDRSPLYLGFLFLALSGCGSSSAAPEPPASGARATVTAAGDRAPDVELTFAIADQGNQALREIREEVAGNPTLPSLPEYTKPDAVQLACAAAERSHLC